MLPADHPSIQIVLALSSALATACYFVCLAGTMKRQAAPSSLFTLAYSHLLGAIALAPFVWGNSGAAPSLDTFWPFAAAIGLLLLSRSLYFYAYARTEVAHITVFSALTPVYALLTGYFFLHESLSLAELGGLIIICASLYGYFLPAAPGRMTPAAFFAPFTRIVSSAPVFFAFLSTIPTAFAAAAQKHLLTQGTGILWFCFLLLLGIGAGALALCFASGRAVSAKQKIAGLTWPFYAASLLLLPLMHVLFCLVILYQPTAVALVLQRTSIVFQVLLAYVFLKERGQIGKKATCIGAMFIGFWLIMA